MQLKDLKKTKVKQKLRYVIYGQEGVGKSTLASGAENPIWLDIEDGAQQLEVARYPFGLKYNCAMTFSDVIEALNVISAQSHNFKTLVIDTVDRLESLLWAHVCEKAGPKINTIEDYGYGKGYVIALDTWRKLAVILDTLRREKDMTIVLLGHSHIRTYKNPEGDDYDRYILRLHDKAGGFLKEWADVVCFMRYEEGAARLAGETKAKGYSTGKRLLHTKRAAAFDAKSRIDLNSEIEIYGPKDWKQISESPTIEQSPKEQNSPF